MKAQTKEKLLAIQKRITDMSNQLDAPSRRGHITKPERDELAQIGVDLYWTVDEGQSPLATT